MLIISSVDYRIAFVADWGLKSLLAMYENGTTKTLASELNFVNFIALDREEMKVYFTEAYWEL